MRVLYLTGNPNRASSNVPVEGWFDRLRPRGLRPVVALHRTGAFQTWALSEGIPTFQIPLPFPSKTKPWPFLSSLWRLRAIVRQHRIQIVHCIEHEIYPVGQYLARTSRLPVVVGIHCKLERGFCEWAFGARRQPGRLFFISNGSMEVCRPAVEGIVAASRWSLLYNGLDMRRFRPEPDWGARFRHDHSLGSEPVVGAVCALRPGKQLEHFIEAASRLSHVPFRIVLAGGSVPGGEAYADNIVREARRRLGDRLVYVGHLEDLRGLYNALDVLVNTSEAESCSMTILEAMACGCPILGYPSTSVHEQVLPAGGEIVAQNDIDALVRALGSWVGAPHELVGRRAGARRRAEETFDIRKIADQLWGEYRSLLA